jgi:ATP-binding cassette subfamily F protein uup
MLDRVSTVVLGLDGLGNAERFADYAQWEIWQSGQLVAAKSEERAGEKSKAVGAAAAVGAKKKLSYKETRELETMEERIAEAEKELQGKHELLLDPSVMSDAVRLRTLSLELEAAQERIDEMYTRWGELEKRSKEVAR